MINLRVDKKLPLILEDIVIIDVVISSKTSFLHPYNTLIHFQIRYSFCLGL